MSPVRRLRPQGLGEILHGVLQNFEQPGRGHKNRAATYLRVFQACRNLGPPWSSHCEPVFFRDGVLSIDVDESVWLTEMSFFREKILERINRSLGQVLVRDLRVRLGSGMPNRLIKPATLTPTPSQLSRAKREEIELWSQNISDTEVRAAMLRAAEKSLAVTATRVKT